MARQRPRILIGNMKMNLTEDTLKDWIDTINISPYRATLNSGQVFICPQTCLIYRLAQNGFRVGAQMCSREISGAFTGQNSVDALCSVGAGLVIVGHPEEREHFIDDNTVFNAKINTALQQGMKYVVYCVGEDLAEREAGTTVQVLEQQLTAVISNISEADFDAQRILICYVPVWAIGTGKTITVEQTQAVCNVIRGIIKGLRGTEIASTLPIIFGGSVRITNTEELLSCPDLDGLMTGGATLRPLEFAEIANIMSQYS